MNITASAWSYTIYKFSHLKLLFFKLLFFFWPCWGATFKYSKTDKYKTFRWHGKVGIGLFRGKYRWTNRYTIWQVTIQWNIMWWDITHYKIHVIIINTEWWNTIQWFKNKKYDTMQNRMMWFKMMPMTMNFHEHEENFECKLGRFYVTQISSNWHDNLVQNCHATPPPPKKVSRTCSRATKRPCRLSPLRCSGAPWLMSGVGWQRRAESLFTRGKLPLSLPFFPHALHPHTPQPPPPIQYPEPKSAFGRKIVHMAGSPLSGWLRAPLVWGGWSW